MLCDNVMLSYPAGLAVLKTRMRSPIYSLVRGKKTRSLSFKEENALAQSLTVVMAS